MKTMDYEPKNDFERAILVELRAIRALAVEANKNAAASLTTARTLTSQYQELRRIIDDVARETHDNWLRLEEIRAAELARAQRITDAAYLVEREASEAARSRYVEAVASEDARRADTLPAPEPNGDGEHKA
jgi:hypothetical protein